MTERDRIEVLRRVEPLASLSNSSLRSLLPFLDEVHVAAGAPIADEGRLCHELVIVAEGRLEACTQGVASAIGPGEALGWDAMRDRGRHNATVRAITPARLLVMFTPGGYDEYLKEVTPHIVAGNQAAMPEIWARYGLTTDPSSIPRLIQQHGLKPGGPPR